MAIKTTTRPVTQKLRGRGNKAQPDGPAPIPELVPGVPAAPVIDDEDEEDDEDEDEEDDEENDDLEVDDDDDEEDDDDDEDDVMPEAERNESAREIERAQLNEQLVHQRATQARAKELARQKGLGSGSVDVAAADRKAIAAADAQRRRNLRGRSPGYYVDSPIQANDESGKSVTYPVGARLPEEVVTKLRSSGDLRRFKKAGVVKKLKASVG